MPDPCPDSEETVRLLDRIQGGDSEAIGELLARHRDEVRFFIDLHLDRNLRSRVDPSDAAQDTLARATARLPDFLERRPMPFRLWIRKEARQRVFNLRRYHEADCRDVRLEVAVPDSSSVALANRFVSGGPTPGEAVEARERAALLAQAIESLKDDDREVLLLRYVEELPHAEIACLLGISHDAARQRYGRALNELSEKVAALGVTGGLT